MNKTQVFAKVAELANEEMTHAHLTDKQYSELVVWAKQVNDSTVSDVSRLAQGKALIALFEKLDVKNVTLPRDEQAKRESNALASYDSAIAKGLAIWKMSLSKPATDIEVIAKTALLDKAYRENLAKRAEESRKRNEFIQAN